MWYVLDLSIYKLFPGGRIHVNHVYHKCGLNWIEWWLFRMSALTTWSNHSRDVALNIDYSGVKQNSLTTFLYDWKRHQFQLLTENNKNSNRLQTIYFFFTFQLIGEFHCCFISLLKHNNHVISACIQKHVSVTFIHWTIS